MSYIRLKEALIRHITMIEGLLWKAGLCSHELNSGSRRDLNQGPVLKRFPAV